MPQKILVNGFSSFICGITKANGSTVIQEILTQKQVMI